jgi:hypothetical protein
VPSSVAALSTPLSTSTTQKSRQKPGRKPKTGATS